MTDQPGPTALLNALAVPPDTAWVPSVEREPARDATASPTTTRAAASRKYAEGQGGQVPFPARGPVSASGLVGAMPPGRRGTLRRRPSPPGSRGLPLACSRRSRHDHPVRKFAVFEHVGDSGLPRICRSNRSRRAWCVSDGVPIGRKEPARAALAGGTRPGELLSRGAASTGTPVVCRRVCPACRGRAEDVAKPWRGVWAYGTMAMSATSFVESGLVVGLLWGVNHPPLSCGLLVGVRRLGVDPVPRWRWAS